MNKEKLKLVARLARQGVGGEKEAALSILASLGLTPDDVENDTKEVEVKLKYRTKFEKTLIFQTYFKLTNTDTVSYFQRKRCLHIFVKEEMAPRFKQDSEKIIESWKRELKNFQEAFIQANRLFSDVSTEGVCLDIPQDTIDEILDYAISIKPVPTTNLLENRIRVKHGLS